MIEGAGWNCVCVVLRVSVVVTLCGCMDAMQQILMGPVTPHASLGVAPEAKIASVHLA